MKYLLLLSLFFAGCSSAPLDREAAQKKYEVSEETNRRRSLNRSEVKTRLAATDLQIGAIESQIASQRSVIAQYEELSDVASSQAMIDNAKARIVQLEAEKAELVQQREEIQRQLNGL